MGIPYVHDRCAQLTVPHNDHPACHYCGALHRRDATVGAFFSPTWYFMPDAEKTGKLELRTNAHVKK